MVIAVTDTLALIPHIRPTTAAGPGTQDNSANRLNRYLQGPYSHLLTQKIWNEKFIT
jgi:hypothetical protein